jgi:hypothetical protein
MSDTGIGERVVPTFSFIASAMRGPSSLLVRAPLRLFLSCRNYCSRCENLQGKGWGTVVRPRRKQEDSRRGLVATQHDSPAENSTTFFDLAQWQTEGTWAF